MTTRPGTAISLAPVAAPFATDRDRTLRDELVARIAATLRHDGTVSPLDGLSMSRLSHPTELGHGFSTPALCVIAQGRKEIRYGDRSVFYDPDRVVVVSTAMPFATRIDVASPDSPYLGLVIGLDPSLVGSVMVESGQPVRVGTALAAIDVSPLPSSLLDAIVRLVRLIDTPADHAFLLPLVRREIVYRLLQGEQGQRVRHIASLGGDGNRINQAIVRLRKTFDQPLSVEDLARELGMSPSTFHHHFRQVTALSPLRFQKQLRLQEARRLMIGEDCDATTAGLRVGYQDASHFTRDYRRLFGAPPMRDVQRLTSRSAAPAPHPVP